jgi:hypothetical protein
MQQQPPAFYPHQPHYPPSAPTHPTQQLPPPHHLAHSALSAPDDQQTRQTLVTLSGSKEGIRTARRRLAELAQNQPARARAIAQIFREHVEVLLGLNICSILFSLFSSNSFLINRCIRIQI